MVYHGTNGSLTPVLQVASPPQVLLGWLIILLPATFVDVKAFKTDHGWAK